MEKSPYDKVIIFSDVSERDGIGLEFYKNDKLIMEIFRDDERKIRTLHLFSEEVSLEFIEESIKIFKEKITWDFS